MKRLNKILFTLSLCASSSFVAAADWDDLTQIDGESLFGEKCGMCHRANGMGTGILARRLSAEQALLESRLDLQPAFIETVVRGGFGIMLPLSRGEVSDEQLQKISAHLAKEDAK